LYFRITIQLQFKNVNIKHNFHKFKTSIIQFFMINTFLEDPTKMSKRKKTNIQLSMSNFQSTSASSTEVNHHLDKLIFNKVDVGI
jgi:hypothetical protein